MYFQSSHGRVCSFINYFRGAESDPAYITPCMRTADILPRFYENIMAFSVKNSIIYIHICLFSSFSGGFGEAVGFVAPLTKYF